MSNATAADVNIGDEVHTPNGWRHIADRATDDDGRITGSSRD